MALIVSSGSLQETILFFCQHLESANQQEEIRFDSIHSIHSPFD
ncbi:MAG: hypothetical protein ACI8RD_005891 [Bacillariaceae sp.]|jgi:hypothetical protein